MDNIKIGYINYKINYTKPKMTLNEDSKPLLGDVDLLGGEIHINNEFSLDVQQETLIHEVLHALSFMYSAELKEEQVEALSKGIYTLLVDNKLVIQHELEDNSLSSNE